MRLGELKTYFENFTDGATFSFSLSSPFSWRGVYNEVCFAILEQSSTKEENLSKINEALKRDFTGWKGGTFTYDKDTKVNFEETPSSYTDGDYVTNLLITNLFKCQHP